MVGSAWSESAKRSWARQRLVAASSLRTGEKVASRSGSGRHCLSASRARALSESLEEYEHRTRCNMLFFLDAPQKAPNNMLQQSHGLLVHQLRDHITQHSTHSVESLVRLANILKSHIVKQDLLDNKDCDRLAELGTRFHDTETERDDLGGKEEVDDVRGVIFDQRADHAQRGQAKVFERSGFGGGV